MKVDYIHGVSTNKYAIEADQRIELTGYQRRHKTRHVEKVEITNNPQPQGQYYNWKIRIEYTEKSNG